MKEELIRQIKEMEAKRKAAFEAMIKEATDDTVKAYENLIKVEQLLRTQLADLEANEKGNPEGRKEEAAKPQLTEAQVFIKKIVEAVAVGSAYTALVPTSIAQAIEKKRFELSGLRKYCTVHPANGDYQIAVEGNGVTVAYVGEGAAISESTPTLTVAKLGSYKLAALVKISQEMLSDVAVDVQQYLVDMIAKGFALKEDAEILNGTGSENSHISGVIPTITAVDARVKTSAAAAAITWAEVKEMLQLLGAYRAHAILVMAQSTVDVIHEFKDGTKYIFDQNKPLTDIWGLPIVVSPDMEAIAASKSVIVAGDFSYYHIADRKNLTLQVLNELYAATDQVGIKAIERIDGKLTMPEAFAVLKTAVA